MGSINRIEQLQTLGERVRLARAKARLSQKGMADLLGISRKTYILVEQGKRDLFTFDLRIIEERTGVDRGFLTGESDTMSSSMRPYVNSELAFAS